MIRKLCARAVSAVLMFVAVGLVGLESPPPAAAIFNPETFTLKNGMRVVVIPNHRVPVVIHMVWYRVGSADEPPGLSGIAHFLEHLMFKATEKLQPGEFSRIVSRNGGTENAFTSNDYTAYYQTVAVDRLELFMGIEAERMTKLRLSPDEVEPERKVILEERRARIGNRPAAILGEHVNTALFMNHPYRKPIIGWEHEIEALPIPEIISFYRRWYAPNNAILVVAGDITADKLRPMAERTYGRIPKGPDLGPRERPAEPPQKAPRRVMLRDAKVRQPSWNRVFLAPSYGHGGIRQVYALQVLDEILDGGNTGRLYKALVVEGKLAVNAGTYYSPTALGPAKFNVWADPRPGVSMERMEEAVVAQIEALRADGVTEEEVARATRRLLAAAVYARDNLSTGAKIFGRALSLGLTVDDIETWPDHIAAVTKADIEEAIAATFREEQSVTALLLPK